MPPAPGTAVDAEARGFAGEQPADTVRQVPPDRASRPHAGRSGPPPLGLIALRARPPRDHQAPEPAGDSAASAPVAPPRKPEKPAQAPRAEPEVPRAEPQAPAQVMGQALVEPTDAPEPTDADSTAVSSLDGPEALMGLSPETLKALLGSPAVVRRESPAQIWQYRETSCVFDIFLYEEADALRVAYFEARDHQAQKQAPEPCLAEILARSSPG